LRNEVMWNLYYEKVKTIEGDLQNKKTLRYYSKYLILHEGE